MGKHFVTWQIMSMYLYPAAGVAVDTDESGALPLEPSTEDFLLSPVPNSMVPREVPAQHVNG